VAGRASRRRTTAHQELLQRQTIFFGGIPDLNFAQRVFGAGRTNLLTVLLRRLVLQVLLTFVPFHEVAANTIVYNDFETFLFIAQRFATHPSRRTEPKPLSLNE
jgi:hypothetical protein